MDDWGVAPKFCLIEASLEKELYLQIGDQTMKYKLATDIGIMILQGMTHCTCLNIVDFLDSPAPYK
jgi:hypothetical protein